MKRFCRGAFLLYVGITFAFCLLPFAFSSAAPNLQINYQGKLTDSSDVAVADGDYSIVFSLYTVLSGGANIWTETQTVTVTNGLFSVMLGSVSSIAGVDFNQTLYLGVNVEADGEMVPRKILGTVPAAFEADKLDGLDSTSFARTDSTSTFSSGFLSIASSTITSLTTVNATSTNATTTTLYVSGASSLGTVTAGTWNGTAIGTQYGGTGQNFSSANGWLNVSAGTFSASTSPTANWFVATSTTQASIFPYASTTALTVSGAGSSFIVTSGNVGIGTTSPYAKLSVVGPVVASYFHATSSTATSTFDGAIALPTTSAAGAGVITVNGSRFLHSYGTDNLFLGLEAGNLTTSGGFGQNIGIGYQTMLNLTSGYQNTAIGYNALSDITTQTGNVALGVGALGNGFSGSGSIGIGNSALTSSSGNTNIAIGGTAFSSNSGSNNIGLGNSVFSDNTGSYNIGLGENVLRSNSGSRNITLGGLITGLGNSGSYNVALGDNSLSPGGLNTQSGSYNVAVGANSLNVNTTGASSTAIGYYALGANTTGASSTAIGINAGRINTTGSKLTFLGANAGYTGSSDGLTNATAIGYNAQVTASNSLILGGTGADAVNVGIGTTSPWGLLSVEMSTANPSFVVSNQGSTTPSFYIGGVNQNGNIGIGTTTPSEKLTLYDGNFLQSPATPKLLSSFSLGSNPEDLVVAGNYLYVIDSGSDDLKIIDVSKPANPATVGTLTSIGSFPTALAALGNYVYVIDNTDDTLKIIDVSNHKTPLLKGSLAIGGSPQDVDVVGRYAYTVESASDILRVVDVSDPSNPVSLSTLSLGSSSFHRIFVVGRYAYIVAQTSNDLKIIDVSNPTAPTLMNSSFTLGGAPTSIFVSGRYAYVSDATSDDLKIIDVSNPSSPALSGSSASFAFPSGVSGSIDAASVFVSGRYAYVGNTVASATDGDNREAITVIDVASSTNPSILGSARLTDTAGSGLVSAVSGRSLFVLVTAANDKLEVLDISGIEVTSAQIHSLEAGNLQVRGSAFVQNSLSLGSSLNVGLGGIFSAGPLGVGVASSTASIPISATFAGNVGVGTTSPYAKLSVVGETVSTYFTATSTTATSTFPGPVSLSTISGTIVDNFTGNTTDAFTINGSSLTTGSALVLNGPSGATAGITDSLFKVEGNVGNVAAGVNIVGGLLRASSTVNTTGNGHTGVNLNLRTNNNPSSNPNIAIGIYNQVDDPSDFGNQVAGLYQNLSVTGSTANTKTVYGTYNIVSSSNAADNGTRNTYSGYFSATGNTNGTSQAVGVYGTASGADTNYAGYFDAGNVYINSGNLGVGTTTPWRKLSVTGTVGFDGLTLNTGAATASLCLSSANEVTRNTDNETCITSSERFKHDIETLPPGMALETLRLLRPVTFEYNNMPGTRYGLIAEEVEDVNDLLVSYDESGLPNSVRYVSMVPLLTQAVQELSARLDQNISNGQIVSPVINSFDPNGLQALRQAAGNWSIDEDGVLTVKEVRTDKLCVGEVCVDEDGFRRLLRKNDIDFEPEVPEEPEPQPEADPPLVEEPESNNEQSSGEEQESEDQPAAEDLPPDSGTEETSGDESGGVTEPEVDISGETEDAPPAPPTEEEPIVEPEPQI